MPFEPDPDTVLRWLWITAALSFLVAIVSGIGEYRGWWDLIGEITGSSAWIPGAYGRQAVLIGMIVGTTVGILVTVAGTVFGAGRDQVASVHEDVRSVDENVRAVHEAVVDNGIQLRKLDKLDDLDIIQAELDAQTGVLGEQLSVLSEIRDGVA